MKLGGWNRSFIVLSVIWLALVLVIGHEGWPDRDDVHRSFRREAVEMMASESAADLKIDKSDIPRMADALERALKAEKPTTPEPTLTAETVALADSSGSLRAEYEFALTNAWKRTANYAGKLFFVWSAPLALLYSLGWSVGWIYRGFRNR